MDSTAIDRTVLIVDDHDPWRRQVLSLLETNGWRVCGEASDGTEAITQVAALQPDVIVLDVELPRMTGIEAARHILANDAGAKILFLSGHSNLDIVAAALAAGGRGYVLKTDAGDELLTAMEAVYGGKRFLGAVLTGSHGEAHDDALDSPHRHELAVYHTAEGLVEGFAAFAKSALEAGKSVVMVTDNARANQVLARLRAEGVEVDAAIRIGRYRQRDVARMLDEFMRDGQPDEARFWKAATAIVLDAAKAAMAPRRVAACGEGCSRLLARYPRAALQVEKWWDELASAYGVDVLCGYDVDGSMSPALKDIIDQHTIVHSR